MQRHFPLPLNLQMFADGNDDPNDGERDVDIEADPDDIEESGREITFDDDEDEDDAGEDDQQDADDADADPDDSSADADEGDSNEGTPPGDKGKGKQGENPTAAAVIAERRKWQEKLKASEAKSGVADRFMQQIGVTDLDEINRRLDAMAAHKLQQQGVPAELAQSMAAQQRQIDQMQSSLRRQRYETEAAALKSDPFFADLDDYRDEFEAIADKTGQSLEQVYYAQRGKARMKEREAEIEARVKANQAKRNGRKVDTSASGKPAASGASKVKLSPEQRELGQAAVKKGLFKDLAEFAKYNKK